MPIQVASAALVREGRLLLAHRHPLRHWYPNCWDLIGGHIEPEEDPAAAARRECREEIGVEVHSLRPVTMPFTDPQVQMHSFLVTSWVGEPNNLAPEEHDDLRWFTDQELPDLTLADLAALPYLIALTNHDLPPRPAPDNRPTHSQTPAPA